MDFEVHRESLAMLETVYSQKLILAHLGYLIRLVMTREGSRFYAMTEEVRRDCGGGGQKWHCPAPSWGCLLARCRILRISVMYIYRVIVSAYLAEQLLAVNERKPV